MASSTPSAHDMGSLMLLSIDLVVVTGVVLLFTQTTKLFLTVITLIRGLPLVVVKKMVLLFTLVLKLFLTVMTLIMGLPLPGLHYMPFIVKTLVSLLVWPFLVDKQAPVSLVPTTRTTILTVWYLFFTFACWHVLLESCLANNFPFTLLTSIERNYFITFSSMLVDIGLLLKEGVAL